MPAFNPRHARRYPVVIGCDEAGRGALCGPVVVAAVWFEPARIPRDLLGALDDSKKLRPAVREDLALAIRAHARVAVAAGSAARIDSRGIRNVTLECMRLAVLRLGIGGPVRFDGLDIPAGLDLPCEAVVRGDGLVPQIAAGSIIAKTTRDAIMDRLALRYGGYLLGSERRLRHRRPHGGAWPHRAVPPSSALVPSGGGGGSPARSEVGWRRRALLSRGRLDAVRVSRSASAQLPRPGEAGIRSHSKAALSLDLGFRRDDRRNGSPCMCYGPQGKGMTRSRLRRPTVRRRTRMKAANLSSVAP